MNRAQAAVSASWPPGNRRPVYRKLIEALGEDPTNPLVTLYRVWDEPADEAYFAVRQALERLGDDGAEPSPARVERVPDVPVPEEPNDGPADPWEPPPAKAGLAATLDAVAAYLRRFAWLGSDEAVDGIALRAAHTHAVEACEYSPLLILTSPAPRSGKSRVLELLEGIVARPWKVISPSEAVLFRTLDERRPTLLLDEVDTIFGHRNRNGDTEPLRAILNAGNRRGTHVPRMVAKGKTFELREFDVYTAKALAGIGELPGTIVDRGIVVRMERAGPNERPSRLRLRDIERHGQPLRDALAAALAGIERLEVADEAFPDGLDDRAMDGWEPLLAIADRAGGSWPERARRAAVVLSRNRDEVADDDPGLRLLGDCRAAFGDDAELASSALVERLCNLPDAGWATWRGDKPITTRTVASFLRRFGIRPVHTRGGSVYRRPAFVPAWERYVTQSVTTVTSVTEADFTLELGRDRSVTDLSQSVTEPEAVTLVTDALGEVSHLEEPRFTLKSASSGALVTDVTDVTDAVDELPFPDEDVTVEDDLPPSAWADVPPLDDA